ncbi:glutamate racemase [Sutterella faecalis]|uniref:Glutamate racemase n=2 Tax=Sutterella TaxID=40544 RepID=A0AAI9SCW2_9BURK|nr:MULTISPECIES: glutamate racemase [Sutterella]KAB7652046.1 glutamate racemase [Sutterella seckii]MBE5692346.1 glutamate racemase [Sutterella sp.]QDA54629.1 glutamate racemase [Sutterella faecalis]
MTSELPIGILDSGFGGLSVARAVRARFPDERILFAADCAYAPYGDRDEGYIMERLDRIIGYLTGRGVKAIVFACNTATAVGVKSFRERLSIPIIGIEPAVFPAVRHTRCGVVGVMATTTTIRSRKYAEVRERALEWAAVSRPMKVEVVDMPCPGLMECVERGDFGSETLEALLKKYVDPLACAGADEIVLGCTHYPFLANAISRHAKDAHLIDPAPAVAEQLGRRLSDLDLLAPAIPDRQTGMDAAMDEFRATGADPLRESVLKRLWGKDARLLPLDL